MLKFRRLHKGPRDDEDGDENQGEAAAARQPAAGALSALPRQQQSQKWRGAGLQALCQPAAPLEGLEDQPLQKPRAGPPASLARGEGKTPATGWPLQPLKQPLVSTGGRSAAAAAAAAAVAGLDSDSDSDGGLFSKSDGKQPGGKAGRPLATSKPGPAARAAAAMDGGPAKRQGGLGAGIAALKRQLGAAAGADSEGEWRSDLGSKGEEAERAAQQGGAWGDGGGMGSEESGEGPSSSSSSESEGELSPGMRAAVMAAMRKQARPAAAAAGAIGGGKATTKAAAPAAGKAKSGKPAAAAAPGGGLLAAQQEQRAKQGRRELPSDSDFESQGEQFSEGEGEDEDAEEEEPGGGSKGHGSRARDRPSGRQTSSLQPSASASASEWEPSGDEEAGESGPSQDSGDEYEPTPDRQRAAWGRQPAGHKATGAAAGGARAAGARGRGVTKPAAGASRPALAAVDGNAGGAAAAMAAARQAGAKAGPGTAKRKPAAEPRLDLDEEVEGVLLGLPGLGPAETEAEGEAAAAAAAAGGPKAKGGKRPRGARLSALPLMLPAPLARGGGAACEPGRLLCEMPAQLSLEGDMGTIGRVVAQAGPGGDEAGGEFQLDLKGVMYETEVAALPGTAALVRLSGGKTEVVIDALFQTVVRTQPGEDYCEEGPAGFLASDDEYGSDGYDGSGANGGWNAKAGGGQGGKKPRKKPGAAAGGQKGKGTGRAKAKPRPKAQGRKGPAKPRGKARKAK